MDSFLLLAILIAALSVAESQSQFIPRKPCPIPNQHCDCTKRREVTCLNVNEIPTQLPNTTGFLDLESNFIGPVVRKDHMERLQDLPLRKLFLNNNNLEIIQDYAFELLYRLLELDISDNYIQALTDSTFKGLKRLTSLYANDAGITTLSARVFEPVTTLRYIDLEDNRITTIGFEFAILPKLKTLLLAENQITQISPGAFSGLSSLTHLSLFGNRLNQPMFSWFRDVVAKNGKIELDRRTNSTAADPNPWLCCSDVAQYHNYVKNMLNRSLTSFSQLDVVCFWPVAVSGRLISKLTTEELTAVPCTQYTTSTTLNPFINANTQSSTPNSVQKVLIHHNFMSNLNDAGAFFILLFVAVVAGSLVGGLCYCYRTKKGKQRFYAFVNIFRPNTLVDRKSASGATTSELTTRPYRQESPAYGATASAERPAPTKSVRLSAVRPTRRAPPAPPSRKQITTLGAKPIEMKNSRYTMETDQSEDEIWSKTERKRPV